MEAHEIMWSDVLTVEPEVSLREASELMRTNDVRHLPVLDRGQIVGILSDRDVRCFLSELFLSEPEEFPGSSRHAMTVQQVMQAKPITVDPDSDLEEVIDSMLDFKIGAVLVADGEGHLQGIISYEDVLRAAKEMMV